MVSKIPPTTPRRVASIMVIYSPEKSKKKSIDTDIRCRGYEVNDRDSERLIPTVGANIVTGGGGRTVRRTGAFCTSIVRVRPDWRNEQHPIPFRSFGPFMCIYECVGGAG